MHNKREKSSLIFKICLWVIIRVRYTQQNLWCMAELSAYTEVVQAVVISNELKNKEKAVVISNESKNKENYAYIPKIRIVNKTCAD